MKMRIALWLTATVLLSGVTAASAASMSPASSSTLLKHASDTLSLTSTQRKKISATRCVKVMGLSG